MNVESNLSDGSKGILPTMFVFVECQIPFLCAAHSRSGSHVGQGLEDPSGC